MSMAFIGFDPHEAVLATDTRSYITEGGRVTQRWDGVQKIYQLGPLPRLGD